MKKITVMPQKSTVTELFNEFIYDRKLSVSERTIRGYENHFGILSKLTDFSQELTKSVCVDLYHKVDELNISQSSKNSYMRTWKTFLMYTNPNLPMPIMKKTESVKEVYSTVEISALLKKPQNNCSFTELRNWCITLVLADTGMRASSVRNLKVEDLQDHSLTVRHTKTHKVQVLPIGDTTYSALHKYAKIVHNYEYLFPNQYGQQMSENALAIAIRHYNRSRGVEKTSIHAWRHTYAKNFILNGGSAFVLQSILGHSTLDMTKEYVRLFNTDITENYISMVDGLHRSKVTLK